MIVAFSHMIDSSGAPLTLLVLFALTLARLLILNWKIRGFRAASRRVAYIALATWLYMTILTIGVYADEGIIVEPCGAICRACLDDGLPWWICVWLA